MQLDPKTTSHNVAICPYQLVLMGRMDIVVAFISSLPFLITVLFEKYVRELRFGNEVLKRDNLSATSVLRHHRVLLPGPAGSVPRTVILGSVLGCCDCQY